MKFFVPVAVCLSVTLSACGGGSGAANDGSTVRATGPVNAVARRKPCPPAPTVKMSKAEIAKLPPLRIPKPGRRPPHRLTTIDLRKGFGPGIPKNDLRTNREKVYIGYFDVSYPEALKGRLRGRYGPREYLLEELPKGEALGLIGMKVGGRREIITTPKSVFPRWRRSWGYTPFVDIYVIDLLGMEPPPDRRVEYRHGTGQPCPRATRAAGGQASGTRMSMSKAEIAKLPPLRIPRVRGRPPHHLEVADLREGSGRVVAKTDVVNVRFIEDTYPQAARGRQGALSGGEVRWPSWSLPYGASRGIHLGLPGARVGGRRELIVPPKVAYPRWRPSWGYAPYVSVYVVDVLGAKPGASVGRR